MSIVAVIPARHASSRFPGKPLAPICGRPMIIHVVERVRLTQTIDTILVATDDERIARVCQEEGIEVVMTSADHETGTDRLAEVAAKYPAEIYVNVQGDEPLIAPSAIDATVAVLQAAAPRGIRVSTAYLPGATAEQLASPSVVHLVPTCDGCVMTLSRLPVPYAFRDSFNHTVHVGLYAFTRDALIDFAARPRGPVERAESIELMRFLEYGDRIACIPIESRSIGVDHPEDIIRVEALLAAQSGAE